MANFFPLTAVILSACKVSFGCEGEIASPWDLRRAFDLAILLESQIAMIVYSAVSVVERSAPKFLMSSETKRQVTFSRRR
jgi:hypothetical protein